MRHKLGQMPGIFDLFSVATAPSAEGSIFPALGENTVTASASPGGLKNMSELCFQYWPESLQDTKDIGWEFARIPGGSHPIARWNSGGERVISFACQFTRDVDANFSFLDLAQGNVPEAAISDPANNPDLRAVQKWLRWYTYPVYDANGVPQPPPRLHLVFPGSQMAWDGLDDILCVMKTCNFEIVDWFNSGVPKRMIATLEFSEVVQYGASVFSTQGLSTTHGLGGVAFQGRDDSLATGSSDTLLTRRGNPDSARGPGDYLRKPRLTLFKK